MGQNNSDIVESGSQSHQRLGIIKVYQASDMFNQNDNIYRLQLKKSIGSQDKFQKWLSRLRQIDTQQARDVLYLPSSFKFQKTGLCGSSGYLTLTFQYFPYVLKTQIRNRRKMSQYFQESQLWYLLYNLVQAGTVFEKKNKKLGDIHPNNCLLNQQGQFKIISSCSLPDQTTNYDKIVDSATNDAFLAPQQIDNTLLEKGIYPNVDMCKAQVYCIGMTLLQASTLQDCFYTYNRGPYKVNKKKLSDLLKIVKQKYRKSFYDIMFNMLEQQTKRRKKCSQLFAQLYPYEQAILQLRDFNITGQVNNSIMGKTIDNGVVEQSTIEGQKQYNNQFGYTQPQSNFGIGTNNYISTANGQKTGYPINNNMSNQNMNYTQNQRYVAPFGNVVYSNTSIDNGFKR